MGASCTLRPLRFLLFFLAVKFAKYNFMPFTAYCNVLLYRKRHPSATMRVLLLFSRHLALPLPTKVGHTLVYRRCEPIQNNVHNIYYKRMGDEFFFASLRLKKREFNRKDAKKRKVRKAQFHAVYNIDTRRISCTALLWC